MRPGGSGERKVSKCARVCVCVWEGGAPSRSGPLTNPNTHFLKAHRDAFVCGFT